MKTKLILAMLLHSYLIFSVNDSILAQKYVNRAELLFDTDHERSIKLLDSALLITDTLGSYDAFATKIICYKADMLLSSMQQDKAIPLIQYAFNRKLDHLDSMRLYEMLSYSEYYNGDYDQSIEYSIKGATIAKRTNSIKWESDFVLSIAEIFDLSLEDKEQAEPYYSRVLKIALDSNYYQNQMTAAFFFLHEKREVIGNDSIRYFEKLAKSAATKSNDQLIQSEYYRQMAYLHKDLGNYKMAIDSALIGYSLAKKVNSTCQNQLMELILSEVYLMDKQIDKAKKHAKQSLAFSPINKNMEADVDIYRVLSKIYESEGDTHNAFLYHKKYTSLKDSVFTLKKTANSTLLAKNYNKEEQQMAINHFMAIAKRNKSATIATISVLVVLTVTFLLIRKRNRNRLKEAEAHLNSLVKEKENILVEKSKLEEQLSPDFEEPKILLKTSGIYLEPSKILYIEASKKHVLIFTEDRENPIIEREGFTKFCELLPDYFIQIHRSFTINPKKIHKRYSRSKIGMANGSDLTISRTFLGKIGELV